MTIGKNHLPVTAIRSRYYKTFTDVIVAVAL